MKALNNLMITICCVAACISMANAQERIMFSRPGADENELEDPVNGLYYINKDGSGGPVHAANFLPMAVYGRRSHHFIVSKTGEVVGVNATGGLTPEEGYGYGTLYRLTAKGVVINHQFDYPFFTGMPLEESPVENKLYGVGMGASAEYEHMTWTAYGNFQSGFYYNYGVRKREILATKEGEVFSTAPIGGTYGQGYVYRWAGDHIQAVYHFSKPQGHYPQGKLLQATDGLLYGVAKRGGTYDLGVIFRIKPDGTDYQVLHNFNKTDGQYPDRGFVQSSSGALYSMTSLGGTNNLGVIFRIMPDGTGFKKIHDIAYTRNNPFGLAQNLLLDSYGYLYGKFPGTSGTIFRIKTDGTGLKILYDEDVTIYNIQLVKSLNPVYKLTTPANASTNVPTTMVFKADSVPGALLYSLELSTTSTFTAPVIINSAKSEIQVSGLSSLTKYYARVRTSLWQRPGPVTSFTTAATTAYSYVTTPANEAIDVAAPTLTVTVKAVSGATTYTVELSESINFDGALTIGTTDNDHRTFRMYNILNSTVYYARVKTDVVPGYGKITRFTTAAGSASLSSAMATDSIHVYPNPSNDGFTIGNTTNASRPKIELIDFMGNVIEKYDGGAGQLEIGKTLPKGVYILKSSNGATTTRYRLIKN
jgi:uncharacterized repeat protein (TIGR03803 family)